MSGTPPYFWDCAARARAVAELGSELSYHLAELEGEEYTGDAKPEAYDHCIDLMRQMVEHMNEVYHLHRRGAVDKAEADKARAGPVVVLAGRGVGVFHDFTCPACGVTGDAIAAPGETEPQCLACMEVE